MRVGLIGTGWWATTVHAPSLAEHPKVDFVGVWGRDPARTAELSERVRRSRVCAIPDRLIDDVDALSFAVPPAVQADLAVRAAERGRHLLAGKADRHLGRGRATARRRGRRHWCRIHRVLYPSLHGLHQRMARAPVSARWLDVRAHGHHVQQSRARDAQPVAA